MKIFLYSEWPSRANEHRKFKPWICIRIWSEHCIRFIYICKSVFIFPESILYFFKTTINNETLIKTYPTTVCGVVGPINDGIVYFTTFCSVKRLLVQSLITIFLIEKIIKKISWSKIKNKNIRWTAL